MPRKAHLEAHLTSTELKHRYQPCGEPVESRRWHRSEKVVIPEGIHLLFLPRYSPELQPAEGLWQLVDEPPIAVSTP